MDPLMEQALIRVERSNLVRDLTLRDTNDSIYDQCTHITAQMAQAPVAMLSIFTDEHQFLKGAIGLPEPWQHTRSLPLSLSFCKHIITTQTPLIIADTRLDSQTVGHEVLVMLDALSYLGVPLTLSDGHTLGSLCVMKCEPYDWSMAEIEIVRSFGQLVSAAFDLQILTRVNRVRYERSWERLEAKMQRLFADLDMSSCPHTFLDQLDTLRVQYRL